MVDVSAHASNADTPTRAKSAFGLAAAFTATIFLSATLLFSVQPMFTKLILPLLGGSPNVWNTAMVFFQAMLLGGYIYAHLLSRYVEPAIQLAAHLGITALGLAFLPLAVDPMLRPPETGMPTLWLISLFAVTVGLPFFALSANAPLLQRWFSKTRHKDAQDPYFLYAASNAGSLIILLAYPFLIEPVFRLGEQTFAWTVGYAALIAALLGSGALALRDGATIAESSVADQTVSESLGARRVALWIVLAFIPSSLMLGVTSFLSSNIAAGPLLWILPLSLYLLTFVIVFAKRPLATTARLSPLMPWVPLAGLVVVAVPGIPSTVSLVGGLAVTFYISLYCHARLVEARPNVSKLTVFYIVMSVGGVLGGIFNALVAPIAFDGVYEYAIVLFASAFILKSGESFERVTKTEKLRAALFIFVAAFAVFIAPALGLPYLFALLCAAMVLYLVASELRLRFDRRLFIVASVSLFAFFGSFGASNVLYKDRSFFSTLSVVTHQGNDGLEHHFMHGDTVHGVQLREPGRLAEPQVYYAPGGVFDTVIQQARRLHARPIGVSMIGLGIAGTTCYERAGDDWTYFEIDPKVVAISRDPSLFSFIENCAPDARVLVGDARQRMVDVPAASQDLVVIDAFSSNAIPAHLVTVEALDMYRSRLRNEDGLIFFHTSNRYADVASVAAHTAAASGLEVRFVGKGPDTRQDGTYDFAASGVLVGKAETLARLDQPGDMLHRFQPSAAIRVWTDDYSSIIGAMRAHHLKDAVVGDSATP